MQKIKRFLKNYKLSIPLLLVLVVGGVAFAIMGGNEVKSETITATRKTVAQEISVTGRVIPAQDVDLAMQSGGKVVSVGAKIGEEVKAGQVLLRVDSADLQIRLGRQQASLQKAQLALNKQLPKTTAADDLKKAYEDGFNTVADTFLDLPSIIDDLDAMIYNPQNSPYMSDSELRVLGDTARSEKQDLGMQFDKAEDRYDLLLTQYRKLSRSSSPQELESMLNDTYALTKELADVVKDARNLIDYIKSQRSTTAQMTADTTLLDQYTQTTNTHLRNLLAIRDTIKNSRLGVNDQSSDIQSSRIDVQQAQLDIQDTIVQINNRTIKSPVDGIVTKVEASVGETISPGSPVISVISANQYEIEANIPEADMAKITIGADTDVTLDAYGSDVIFKAKVVAIDPAETLLDGVATYKTKFQFVDKDDRVKSGMTASIVVRGEKKENVIAIPQRSVITKDNRKIVQVIENEKIVEKQVQTGLRGSDGSIEIISGINEGDKIVVFTDKK